MKDFIQQNNNHQDIEIVELFIEALEIFNYHQWSTSTKLDLVKHQTYLTEKERIRLELVGKNEELRKQIATNNKLITTNNKLITTNNKLITTRTEALETGLSN